MPRSREVLRWERQVEGHPGQIPDLAGPVRPGGRLLERCRAVLKQLNERPLFFKFTASDRSTVNIAPLRHPAVCHQVANRRLDTVKIVIFFEVFEIDARHRRVRRRECQRNVGIGAEPPTAASLRGWPTQARNTKALWNGSVSASATGGSRKKILSALSQASCGNKLNGSSPR